MVHNLVARRLIEGLSQVLFKTTDEGEVLNPLAYNPQFLAQCLRFLSDNNVTGLDLPGSKIEEVKKAYAERAPFKAPFKLTGT